MASTPGAMNTIPRTNPTAHVAIAWPTRIVVAREGGPFVVTSTTRPGHRRSCRPGLAAGDVAGGRRGVRLVRRRAPVAHVPSLRRGEPIGMPAAEVIGMRITFDGEPVEPHLRHRILVRQRDRRGLAAPRP